MSKQDRGGVRTAQDLERKYDLAGLMGIKKAVKQQEDALTKTDTILENFIKETIKDVDNLQSQIDGNITTHFHEGVPTMNNLPASEWTDYEAHLGDLYYDKETGTGYRFIKDGDTYKWLELADNAVSEALALANKAQDTADSKRRVFVVKPTPPYDNGDLWFNEGEIYICQISKGELEEPEDADFITATKYTDDTKANKVGNELTVLSGSVLKIIENNNKFSVSIEKEGQSTKSFMEYTAEDGLSIGYKNGDSWKGGRAQIGSDEFSLLDSAGKTLASFGTKDICLGNESKNATIHLCGDEGTIESKALYEDWRRLTLKSRDSAVLYTQGQVGLSTHYNVPNNQANFADAWLTLTSRQHDHPEQPENWVQLRAEDSTSYEELMFLPGQILLTALENGNSSRLRIASNGAYLDTRLQLSNNMGLYGLATDGSAKLIGCISSGDNLLIGSTDAAASHTGNTNIYAKNGNIYLHNQNTYLRWIYSGGYNYFSPNSDAEARLGSTDYRWYRLYQSHSSVSTSDKRQKENIKGLGKVKKSRKKKDGTKEEFDVYTELFDRLEPVEYNFINSGKRKDFGLIAQDVLEVMLELGLEEDELDLVHHDTWIDEETGKEKDGYGIAYENLIPLLIYEVQKLKGKVH